MATPQHRPIRRAAIALASGLALLGLATPAAAGLYKCVGAGGEVSFQDRPCAAGQRSKEIERAKPETREPTRPERRSEVALQMPTRGAGSAGMGYRVDTSEVRSGVWLDAIAQAGQQAPLRAGRGNVTLLRVLLEGERDVEIQLQATKLKGLGESSGGGTYREVAHGDFVLMEHIPSASRKNGEDLLKIASPAHGHAELRVPVPDDGGLAVLGDVILSAASATEMGALEATLDTRGVAGLSNDLSMLLGPIAVGGRYGEKVAFDARGRTRRIALAPGTYKVALPDFDAVRSRFTIQLEPGQLLQIHLRAESPEIVEWVGSDSGPVPASADH